MFLASNGELFGVCGASVYYISNGFTLVKLGSIAVGTGRVYMADNGTTLWLVDGTLSGYSITLATHAFATIVDGNFLGGTGIGYLDTYMVLSQPSTQSFYSTLSNSTTLDPLYIAAKTGSPDKLVTLGVVRREIWLIGELTTEIWNNVGGAAFPFAIMNGVFIEHGCVARDSLAKHDLMLFWLSKDREGHAIVTMGVAYQAQRISTHALEQEIQGYSTVSDAVGFCFQQDGHIFYQLTFPTADKTWVYDAQTKAWHERVWLDEDGEEHRHRANVGAFAYGVQVVGDWENGKLYRLDPAVYTDDGDPIIRRRGFPHLVNDGKRVSYQSLIADIESGGAVEAGVAVNISLRWSDDRGKSWGNPVQQTLGQRGDYINQPQWNRLGLARDRVFELFWSVNAKTALNGAYIDALPLGS